MKFSALAFSLMLLTASFPLVNAADMIIDHKCVDLSKVPSSYIEDAKKTIRIAYGHTSHGSQIVSGMQALKNSDPLYSFNSGASSLSLIDKTPKGDLGNPDRTSWADRTRDFLKGPGKDRNMIIWSWCGQVSKASAQDIQTYLDLMSGLEKEFPTVKFVYMTGHLDGSGESGNLNQRNEQIREFCRTNGKILFDFADIESYDPDGQTNYMKLFARDSCDYGRGASKGNWADEWLQKNPSHKFAIPSEAAHSRPLNGAMKASAFWWLLARQSGWAGK